MLGGISVWQLLIILVIVILVFGGKRLRNLGGDLGGAIKGFKKAMTDSEKEQPLNKDEDPSRISQTSKDAEFDKQKQKDQDKA